jgi:hypothetical protein
MRNRGPAAIRPHGSSLDFMGKTANLFRITQTDEKIRRLAHGLRHAIFASSHFAGFSFESGIVDPQLADLLRRERV